jgi:hypothetical protein
VAAAPMAQPMAELMLTSNRMDPLALIQHDRKLKEQVRFDE